MPLCDGCHAKADGTRRGEAATRAGTLVRAGLRRAVAAGRVLGRRPIVVTETQWAEVRGLGVRKAARLLGMSVNTLRKARRAKKAEGWSL